MSWWEYVQRVAKTSRQRDITDVTGVDATEVTRWKNGKLPSVQNAATFARGYDRPVLEAFVSAGFLTAEEARQRPAARTDLSRLTNDELLELVRARMREGVMGNAEHPAATSGVNASEVGTVSRLRGERAVRQQAAKKGTSRTKQARTQQDEEAEAGGA